MNEKEWYVKLEEWAFDDARLHRMPLALLPTLAEHLAMWQAAEKSAEKDAPMILTDMPRPWSEGDMKKGHENEKPHPPQAVDGAMVAEFCECGISIQSHTGVYCIFRPASNVPGICQCGYMAKFPICTKCGRTYPPKKDSL